MKKKYIIGIIKVEINFNVKDKNKLQEIKKLMIDSITAPKSYIREINRKELISMRETRKKHLSVMNPNPNII